MSATPEKDVAIESSVIDERNKRTFLFSMTVPKNLLRLIGVWPLDDAASGQEILLNYLKRCVFYLLSAFILVPSTLKMFLVEKDAQSRLKIFGPQCTCALNAAKYSILLHHRETIKDCMKYMWNDWRKVISDDDYELMMSHVRVGRTLAIVAACFNYCGSMSYRTIVPLMKGRFVVNNVTVRAFACPSYFIFFDEQKSPNYEFVFAAQFLAGFLAYTTASGVCGLTTFFTMHVCGQLEILMRKMEEMVECGVNNETRIADVVEHQIRTRNFLKRVENVLQYICLLEIMGCTMLVCLMLYYFLMSMERGEIAGMISFTVLITSFGFNLFIYCYIGELLLGQGLKVALVSCTLNWNHLPMKSAQKLILIILMSNHPPKLMAGKVMNLSLSNFTTMLKTAVGYFNILRNMI